MTADAQFEGPWIIRKLRQFWPVLPLLGILFALMFSDLDVMGHMPWSQDQCAMKDMEQSSLSAKMYLPLANWALRYTPTPSVAILLIDSNTRPAGLLTNTCDSRAFLAKLVENLNTLGAHAIVIDQYFSADSCADGEKNGRFIASMEGSTAPIVVGQPSHAMSTEAASGCLALTKHLEFSPRANVHYGLTRINADDLKVPLRWPVFAEPGDAASSGNASAAAPQQLPAAEGDTLSLVAARMQDPNIESNGSVAKLLAKGIHPYTTFIDLPQINAMTVMCSVEKNPADIFGKKLGDTCASWVKPLNNLDGHNLSLGGKVVVVGAVSQQDMKPFPTGEKPGVFMQANYVQSILDHRFLIEVPSTVTLACLMVVVLVVYCLYWAHDRKGHALLSTAQAVLMSISILAVVVLVSILVLVTTNYFTPLWAICGVAFFMVFRYLEELGHSRGEHLLGQLTHGHLEQHSTVEAVSAPRSGEQTGLDED